MARYIHVIDAKGRMVLPAKLRETMGKILYITHSLDRGFLVLYSAHNFASVRDQLEALPGTDPIARRLRREIIGEALMVTADGQGRLAFSQELWDHIEVNPGDSVCLIDMGSSVQICGLDFYKASLEEEAPLDELVLDQYEIKGIL